jgi:hypothetical protein
MIFFFGINSSYIESKLTIPRFQNRKKSNKDYLLYEATIHNKKWVINCLNDVELNQDFYQINSDQINNDQIFFLATPKDIIFFENNNNNKLIELNNYTDTTPAFRANLQVSIEGGGFASYQSEYPYFIITKKGSVLSSISSLSNKSADQNIIFLRNVYEDPIKEEFKVYFIDIKNKKILKEETILTNFTNEIIIEEGFIKPEVYIFTDKYVVVPIFCSIKDKHISLEHTHPPHEFVQSSDRFKRIAALKQEFKEIIDS